MELKQPLKEDALSSRQETKKSRINTRRSTIHAKNHLNAVTNIKFSTQGTKAKRI